MNFCLLLKKIRKTASKNLSGKYSQKFIDHAKKFATDTLKTTSGKSTQKTTETTCGLIGNRIADKIKLLHEVIQRLIHKQMKN